MRRPFDENKRSEILVHRDKDSFFCGGPFQNSVVPWIGAAFSGFSYIMSLLTKPLRKSVADTCVNKELHLPATPTESRESFVITACA